LRKNANIFGKFFGENNLIIITSVPGIRLIYLVLGVEVCPKFEVANVSEKFSAEMKFRRIDPCPTRDQGDDARHLVQGRHVGDLQLGLERVFRGSFLNPP
jgi:hypothetical protein